MTGIGKALEKSPLSSGEQVLIARAGITDSQEVAWILAVKRQALKERVKVKAREGMHEKNLPTFDTWELLDVHLRILRDEKAGGMYGRDTSRALQRMVKKAESVIHDIAKKNPRSLMIKFILEVEHACKSATTDTEYASAISRVINIVHAGIIDLYGYFTGAPEFLLTDEDLQRYPACTLYASRFLERLNHLGNQPDYENFSDVESE